MHCQECGFEIKESGNVRFCPNCGKEIAKRPEPGKKGKGKFKIVAGIVLVAAVLAVGYIGTHAKCKVVVNKDGECYVKEGLFEKKGDLTAIDIPTGTTSIGDFAFQGCFNLEDITLPDGVVSIGDYAFVCCYNLKSIELPDGLKSIGEGAFFDCWNLPGIGFPDTVENIGDGAFAYFVNPGFSGGFSDVWENNWSYGRDMGRDAISRLSEINPYAFMGGYNAASGGNVFDLQIYKSATEWNGGLYLEDIFLSTEGRDLASLSVKDGTKYIASNGISKCPNLSDVELPKSLKGIGSVFGACIKLSSIELPEGLTTIGPYAFGLCDLESITIPESVTSIGCGAFNGCYKLKTVELSEGLVSIGDGAFYWCGVSNIELPETLISIGENAFSVNLNGVVYMELPDNLLKIGRDIHQDLSLDVGTVDEGGLVYAKNYLLGTGDERPDNVIVKDGTTLIANGAFSGCESINSIELPESLVGIGDNAFAECHIQSIELPNNLTSIGNSAFVHCDNLRSLELPNGLTSIGNDVFEDCASLKSIEIPKSLTHVGKYVFRGSELQKIKMPKNLVGKIYIPDNATVTTY